MADAQNLPQPSLPPQDGGQQNTAPATGSPPAAATLPEPNAPATSAPAPAPQPAAAQPTVQQPSAQPQPVSSRLMQNLQTVSPVPFQDGSTASPSAPGEVPQQAGAVPQESIGFSAAANQSPATAASPAAGGQGGQTPPPPQGGEQPAAESPKPAKAGGMLDQILGGKLPLIGGAVLGLVLLLGGGYYVYSQFLAPEPVAVVNTPSGSGTTAPTQRTTTLTYWGLWEPEEVMAPLIEAYEAENPGIEIEYVQQKSDQYRQRVQTAIREGSGPDIFRFHNTWIPMFEDDLEPAPTAVLSPDVLEQNFYPIMNRDLVVNEEVYGVPLMYEGLALLYNANMLEAAAAQPPQDWNQVRTLANQLTIRDGERIERAGIALGTTSNVDHFSDILGLMLLQNSANPADPTSVNVQHAMEFYTIFSRVDGVWDDTFPASVDAFANEQVAMIFAPSWRIFEIQRANPNLNIGVVRTPQLGGTTVTWGTYWAEGVSVSSQNSEEAWDFLAFLAEEEQLRTFHDEGASYRAFGELYPRVDMAQALETNPLIAPYLEDALYAYSWFLASQTHDEGLNDQMIQYYTDAVNASNESGNVSRSLNQIAPGVQQVLSRYSIPVPAPAEAAATQ